MDKKARASERPGSARQNVVLGNNSQRRNKPTPRPPQALLTDTVSPAALRAENPARDLRRRRLARIVAFGERPIIELVDGLAHDPPADAHDLDCRIARVEARLDAIGPDLLRALGGDRLPLPPPLRLVEG
jgi:hypothetical protein